MEDIINGIMVEYINNNDKVFLLMSIIHQIELGLIKTDEYKEFYKNLAKEIYNEGLFTFKQYNKALIMAEEIELEEH